MATDRKGGSLGTQRSVPSWLNSPAWSHAPTTLLSTKRANFYGTTADIGSNEREKPNVSPQSSGREKAQVHPPIQEGPPVRHQGDSSLGSRSGSLNSSVQSLPSSDIITSSPGSDTTPSLSQSSSLSNSDRTLTGSATLDARIELFTIELSRKRIHLAELQRMSAQGIPDHGGLRSMTWKLLLGYMPRNREEWAAELSKKRAEYATFKEELLVNPSEVARRRKEASPNDFRSIDNGDNDNDDDGLLHREDITHDDHPLSLGSSSVWHQYFQDTELSDQIDRDVKRTHPDIQFFCGESSYALKNQEALKRALFIFAKLNPGIRYVQGMNEVLAPLYYVFRTDPDEEYSVHAEADAFFCFVELLSDFRDNFCQQLDNSAVGVRATLSQLNSLLRRSDEELWRHLELSAKVNPQFYAFRWITLLLTQEFNFPDCLRLWDSFLSNPAGPLEILLRVCCAMLLCVRSRLLAGDFTTNLKLLQNYPSVNIHHLLGVADNLRG